MISIIIPVYNQAKSLDRCLESIKKQNYDDYEIIVVNDASSENIKEVIEKYKVIFGIKLNYFENEKNQGAPATRNIGFSNSSGEFLIFCDADTIMEKEMLRTMCKTIRSMENIAFVYSSFYWGRKSFKLFEFDYEKLKEMPYIHSNSLIRRNFFPKNAWDESIKKLQDWDLWLTICEQGGSGFWIDQFLFKIEDTRGTMSSWLPSFAYKLFPFLPKVKKYKEAVKIIKTKHKII